MVRIGLCSAMIAALAACQPTVPDSGRSDVVFSQSAQAQRNAQLAQPVIQPVASQPLPAEVIREVTGGSANDLEAQRATAANSGVAPINASPSNPAPVQLENPGISSEQDFEAVSSRRTIASDAERIAANRAQYQTIAPTSLPKRSGTNQPNIVEYALRTNNPVGATLYRRINLRSAQRYSSACAKFPSPDQAQMEFLLRGGPEKDRKGLDPDGDGFACTWDPTPFRNARAAAAAAPASAISQGPIISSE